jgi:hypothetical protein
MKKNQAFGPGNVVNVEGQGFSTAQAPIIDQPEGGANTGVLNRVQHRLDLLHVQGPSSRFPLWFPFYAIQERRGLPSLTAEPAGEPSQSSQAPIVGSGCERFLACEKCLENVSSKCGDMFLAYLREQRRQIFCVTLAGASRERGDFEELLERTGQG